MSTSVVAGQTIAFRAVFRSAAGAAADPTSVTWRVVRKPDGLETAYVHGVAPEATKLGTGSYELRLQLSAAGEWYCRVEGAGALAACAELLSPVQVRASAFGTAQ